MSHLIYSSIRKHSLKCSKAYRAGKFTRVGSDYETEIEVDVECFIRDLRAKYPTLHPALEPEEGEHFVTGELLEKIRTELDRAVARMCQNKVQRQPTVGCTLGRTR